MAWACLFAATAAGADGTAAIAIVGDRVPAPLSAVSGDAARGRALVLAREDANCLLCHAVSDPAVRFAGNIGPSLDGVGARLDVGQLRLRVVDDLRVNPSTIMPSYYRSDGLDRVAAAYRGRPILNAGQVEDIVAWLVTLR